MKNDEIFNIVFEEINKHIKYYNYIENTDTYYVGNINIFIHYVFKVKIIDEDIINIRVNKNINHIVPISIQDKYNIDFNVKDIYKIGIFVSALYLESINDVIDLLNKNKILLEHKIDTENNVCEIKTDKYLYIFDISKNSFCRYVNKNYNNDSDLSFTFGEGIVNLIMLIINDYDK